MSDLSSNLQLSYLAAAQAQKHVTVNDTFRRLDAIVQLSVVSATTSAQPASPADGAVYILPAGKTGTAWGAMANEALAYYRDGAWEQISPREGWIAFVKDTDKICIYDGAAWSQVLFRNSLGLGSAALKNTGTSGDFVPLLNGVNTWSGQQNFNGVITSSQAGASTARDWLYLLPTDFGNGKPGLFFSKSATANTWSISAYAPDGNGVLNFGPMVVINGNTVWHTGNDGAGSGLDADTLDGVQGSDIARLSVANSFLQNATFSKWIKAGATTDAASTAGAGAIRWNSANTKLEVSDGANWIALH